MNQEIDNKKQKARLALIMKTSKLRLWFYDPTTRHCCYLSEAGDYEREYNPADFALFFHRDDLDRMRAMVFAICEGKMDTQAGYGPGEHTEQGRRRIRLQTL